MTQSNEFNVEAVNTKGAELYAELEPELKRLHDDNITLLMATVDDDNYPHASYTPFAMIDNDYYIFIADIAYHTKHVKQRPTFDVLIIDDETKTKNIYARKRVTYQVNATEVARDSEEFEQGMAALTARAGKTVNVLRDMADFHLFRLTPTKGTLVTGFGKAFKLNPQDTSKTTHMTGDGGKGHGTIANRGTNGHGVPKTA